MTELHRNTKDACPCLGETISDLICDFELLADRLASKVGMLRAICSNKYIYEELEKICELIYHSTPSLRMETSLTLEEIQWLKKRVDLLQREVDDRCKQFVLPIGNEKASLSHILRVESKEIVRLLYRHIHNDNTVEPLLLDFYNLLSSYFFMLALNFNKQANVAEIPFISRNY